MIFQMKNDKNAYSSTNKPSSTVFTHGYADNDTFGRKTIQYFGESMANVNIMGLLFLCVFYRLSSHHTIRILEILACQRL